MTQARRIARELAAMTCVFLLSSAAVGQDPIATLRNSAIDEELTPPPLSNPSNDDRRRVRNYPEQPPIIPHTIRGYQVDLNTNRCLACHSRRAVEESQAPMVSVTHFVDRDGQMRAFISPRRYFCTQCHVTQTEVRPLIGNDFIDVDALLAGPGAIPEN